MKAQEKRLMNLNKQLEAKKAELDKANDDIENLKIRFSSVEQKTAFIQENIIRINSEIAALESEEADIKTDEKNLYHQKLKIRMHRLKS